MFESQSPKRVYQDEIDVARQEYIDLDVWHGVPPRAHFTFQTPANPHLVAHGVNTGDYSVMVYNNDFVTHVDQLSSAWTAYGAWDVVSQYRNPAHQRYHIPAASGPGFNSWHLYACAVDVSTGTGASLEARKRFFSRMEKLAYSLGFDYVEPGQAVNFTHVHVEFHFCQ